MSQARNLYPLMLDVTDRLVVIIGGGAVALRKAVGLIDAGATRVKCVSPAFHVDLPDTVIKVAEPYAARHVDGAGLVFAATDKARINDAVVEDCRARGILVSRADSQEDRTSDFATPALFRRSTVTVTVSTGGSPALAAQIREGLIRHWDQRWTKMAEAMQTLRPLLLDAPIPIERRREIFRTLASEAALDAAGAGGLLGVQAWMTGQFPDVRWSGGDLP